MRLNLSLCLLVCITLKRASVLVEAFAPQSSAARAYHSNTISLMSTNPDDVPVSSDTQADGATSASQTKNQELEGIKEEIAKLEQSLKAKRRELASIEGLAEQYSKAGYSRKVAELDGFRKTRLVCLPIK